MGLRQPEETSCLQSPLMEPKIATKELPAGTQMEGSDASSCAAEPQKAMAPRQHWKEG